MRHTNTYSSSCSSVVLVYLQPFLLNIENKKTTKPLIIGVRLFKVMDFDTTKKLVTSACCDRQHIRAYSSSCPQAVTYRSTNRVWRRVTSFQPKHVTNYATPPTPAPWCHLVNDFVS